MSTSVRRKKARARRKNRFPIYPGVDHPLFDPTTHPQEDAWKPANRQSALLIVCIEAGRNLAYLANRLDAADPAKDRVGLTLMATPLAALVEHLMNLQAVLRKENAGTSRMAERDVKKTDPCAKRLNDYTKPPRLLWKLRNERSAHHDSDFTRKDIAPEATLEFMLPIFADALMLLALLARRDGYNWIRSPVPGDERQWEKVVHDPASGRSIAVPFTVDHRKHIVGIGSLTETVDPLLRINPVLEDLNAAINRLLAICPISADGRV